MALSYTGKSKVIGRIVEALRPATRSRLGLVRAGSGIDISDDGTISTGSGGLTADDIRVEDGGLLTKTVGRDGTVTIGLSLGPATASTAGIVKVGDGLSVSDDGTLSVRPGGDTEQGA